MLNITVLVSGGGTNLQAIIDAIETGDITNARITGVVSSNPDAYAIKRADTAGIPVKVVCKKDYPDSDAKNNALIEAVKSFEPDLIVLAGFMTVIPEKLVMLYPDKIINIHPALIPSFCGLGYYGLKVHEKVLERGVKVTGATVHFVDAGADTGPIIAQKAVEIKPGDTPEVLQKRVMQEAEWKLLPHVIDCIANGKIFKDSNNNYFLG